MGVVYVEVTVSAYFCGIESGDNPGKTLSHAERPERSHGARNV